MNKKEKLLQRIDDLEHKIDLIRSNGDRRIEKLEEQISKIEERIKNYEKISHEKMG